MGLILSDQTTDSKKKLNLIRLIQSWNRFILHQIHAENLEARKKKLAEMERKRNASESPRGHGYNILKPSDFPSIGEEWSRHSRGKSQLITTENDGN